MGRWHGLAPSHQCQLQLLPLDCFLLLPLLLQLQHLACCQLHLALQPVPARPNRPLPLRLSKVHRPPLAWAQQLKHCQVCCLQHPGCQYRCH